MTFTVLVVEDFQPFRQFIRATLEKLPDFRIIGEVSDGEEAVQKAEELRPDFILLDIGLPTLNGIEVARRIRTSIPDCKIIFLSQESSADVVEEAFELGAVGFVVKARAGCELAEAMGAVRQGQRFVSKEVLDHDFPIGQYKQPRCGSGR